MVFLLSYKKLLLLGGFLLLMLLALTGRLFAASGSSGIATYVDVTGTTHDGDLVSYIKGTYKVSTIPYDPTVYGIIAENPAVAFESSAQSAKAKPVVSNGTVYVRVTASNGEIAEGDLLTSAGKGGLAMKATTSGYVIGPALESFKPKNKNDITLLPVNFHVFYFYASAPVFTRLFDVANLTSSAAYEQPLKVFKYVVAAIIFVATLLLGFFSFGRIANSGIEALGRNPLASRMIQLGIFFNVLITITIIIAGFGLAFLVIRL